MVLAVAAIFFLTAGISQREAPPDGMSATAARSEDHRCPIGGAELPLVAWASMALVAGVWILRLPREQSAKRPKKKNLLPFQVVIAERPADEQRIFRELWKVLPSGSRAHDRRMAGGDATSRRWRAAVRLRSDAEARLLVEPHSGGSMINHLGFRNLQERRRGLS